MFSMTQDQSDEGRVSECLCLVNSKIKESKDNVANNWSPGLFDRNADKMYQSLGEADLENG